MRNFRVKPISASMASVQISCECGSSQLTRESVSGKAFSHSVLVGQPERYKLFCDCGLVYEVQVQSDHFHVFELGRQPGEKHDRRRAHLPSY